MKIVITGGPSCGKTSVINYFKKKGQNTIDEVAREVIAERNLQSKKLTDTEFNSLEEEIHKRMIEKEREADHFSGLSMYFLDRSLVDIDGYCLHRYKEIPEKYRQVPIVKNYNNYGKEEPLARYHKVFVLDRLPLVNDGLRLEDNDDQAQQMHECIIKAYELKGYEPIKVPLIEDDNVTRAIRKRAEFIKAKILGLDTIDEKYEKLQESYNEARRKYNFPRSTQLHFKGYNPLLKKVTRTLMSGDNSW